MKIQLLPDNIRDQIAAGEVVERPASIVKEVIENALDAQAQNIEIILEEGGIKRIMIQDDGHGMDRKDALLAVERHATSKIRILDDLFHIQSFGFRGEALAAMSAVSDFTLTTRSQNDESATKIQVEGGLKKAPETEAHPIGTTIEVCNLFKYTPARLAYLKNTATEYRACLKEIQGFALQNPSVSFRVTKDEKQALDLPAETSAVRTAQIFKTQTEPLIACETKTPEIQIQGFIAAPGMCARSRNHQFLFVNGRRIEDHKLSYAIREAYVQSCGIEKHLHPVFSLSITIDPILVDVNVHPRKLEVKFAEPGMIFSALQKSVGHTLQSHHFGPSPMAPSPQSIRPPIAPTSNYNRPAFTRQIGGTKALNDSLFKADLFRNQNQARNDRPTIEPQAPVSVEPETIRVIGQSSKRYIVAETPQGLYFFDQHALHERQRFEQFWQAYKAEPLQSQDLLVPHQITLGETDILTLADNKATLEQLQFKLEFPTDDQVKITGWPTLLEGEDFTQVLQDLVEYFENEQVGEHIIDQIMRKCLEYKSCRGAVMFGDHLDISEMEKLIQDFDSTDWNLLCPHGRPNHFFMSFEAMDTKFHR